LRVMLKLFVVLLLLFVTISLVNGQTLVFEDDFNTFNFSIWQHE